MKQFSLLIPATLLISQYIQAGVLSGHAVIRCSAGFAQSEDCKTIKTSPLEGRFAMSLGLDGSLSGKSPDQLSLTYQTKTTSRYDTGVKTVELVSSDAFRFGPSLRLHLFDKLGLSLDMGVERSSLGSSGQTGYQLFSLNYSSSYVGGSIYLPVQKIDTWGLFGSFRKYSTDKGEATFGTNSTTSYEAIIAEPIRETSIGLFASIFYLTFVSRSEAWKITDTADTTFSPIKSKSSGFELGVSGPIWHIWP